MPSTPMNLLDGVVRAAGAGEPVRVEVGDVALPAPTGLDDAALAALDGEKVVYGVRPEYLRYAAEPTPGALSGAVRVVENLGSAQLVTLEGPAGFVQVVVDEDAELELGDTGYAVPRADRVLVYRDGELVTAAAAERRLPPTVCPTPDAVGSATAPRGAADDRHGGAAETVGGADAPSDAGAASGRQPGDGAGGSPDGGPVGKAKRREGEP
jgi:hypothetical protein